MALTDNLISYYDLEDSSDALGNNALTTAGTFSYSAAKKNNGAAFNSVDDRLHNQTSNMSLDWSGNYTWSWWTNKPGAAAFTGYCMDHVTTTGNNRRVLFIWDNTGGAKNLLIYCGGFGGSNTFTIGSLANDTWYHWILVKTGTSFELFKDNVSQGTKTAGTANYAVNKFAIGGSVDPNAGGTCTFDMVGLWNKAMDSTERTQLYNSGAGLSYAEIIGGGGVVLPQFQALGFAGL